jgi:hypothetical protein
VLLGSWDVFIAHHFQRHSSTYVFFRVHANGKRDAKWGVSKSNTNVHEELLSSKIRCGRRMPQIFIT